ncbi:MAG: FkbM family methyltransferase [Verrucomicrobiales bacterium]|nr:FkbM family methyltransferase [Verrucomicrobiales bacterium]
MEDKLSLLEKFSCYHRLVRYRYRTEPDTASFIDECVQKGDVCLDIGAHKGVVTHMLTKRVGEKGAVIAFEPQKELFEWLKRMISSFRFSNVTVEAVALAEKSGNRTLYRSGVTRSGSLTEDSDTHLESITVEAIALDDYCESSSLDEISFVKIDVDGFELQVLEGGARTLRKFKPILLVEISDKDLTPVTSLLGKLGYGESEFEYRGRRYKGSETSSVPHRHAKSVFRNFLFRPKG